LPSLPWHFRVTLPLTLCILSSLPTLFILLVTTFALFIFRLTIQLYYVGSSVNCSSHPWLISSFSSND
jgi:hypothetical protein